MRDMTTELTRAAMRGAAQYRARLGMPLYFARGD